MQSHQLSLNDQIIQANKLFATSFSESKSITEAIDILKNIIHHPEFKTIKTENLFAFLHHLKRITESESDNKNLAFNILIELFAAIDQLKVDKDSDELLTRIITLIDPEKESVHFDKLFRTFDQSKNQEARKAITKSLFEKRIASLPKWLEHPDRLKQEIEAHASHSSTPTSAYEILFTRYQEFIFNNDKLLEKTLEDLTKLIAQSPPFEQAILDMLEVVYQKNKKPSILKFIAKNKTRAEKLLESFYREFLTSVEKEQKTPLTEVEKYNHLAEQANETLNELVIVTSEIVANKSADPSLKIRAYDCHIKCNINPSWQRIIQLKFLKRAYTQPFAFYEGAYLMINHASNAAKDYKLEYKPHYKLEVFKKYAEKNPSFDLYLQIADLGDISYRLKATELLLADRSASGALDKALKLNLQTFKQALDAKDIQLTSNICKDVFAFRKKYADQFTREQNNAFEEILLLSFENPNLIALAKEDLNFHLCKFSLEGRDKLIANFRKTYEKELWFLEVITNFYAAKMKELSPSPTDINAFTEFSALKATREKEIAAEKAKKEEELAAIKAEEARIHAELEAKQQKQIAAINSEIAILKMKLTHPQNYFQQICQWLQNYSKKMDIEVNSSAFRLIQDELIKLVKLSTALLSDKNHLSDLIALLDISNANESAIALQKNMLNFIINTNPDFAFFYYFDGYYDTRYQGSVLFQAPHLINLLQNVVQLPESSPFFDLVNHAIERYKAVQSALLRSFKYNFYDRLFPSIKSVFNEKKQSEWRDNSWPLAISRLMGCPVAISKLVNDVVPTSFSLPLGVRERLALIASAHLLVLHRREKDLDDITNQYYRDGFEEISRSVVPYQTHHDGYTYKRVRNEKALNKIIQAGQKFPSEVKDAVEKAQNFLKAKSHNERYEYYNLAALLWRYVEEARDAKERFFTPTLYLWIKIHQPGVDCGILKVFDHGMAAFLSDSKQVTPDDVQHWQDFFNPYVRLLSPAPVKAQQLEPSAPEPDEPIMQDAPAPTYSLGAWDPRNAKKPTAPIEEIKSTPKSEPHSSIADSEVEPGAVARQINIAIELEDSPDQHVTVKATCMALLPTPVALIIHGANLYFKHCAETPMTLNETCQQVEPAEGLATLPTDKATKVSIEISEPNKEGVRDITTSVESAFKMTASLELTLFAHKTKMKFAPPMMIEHSIKRP